MRKPGSFLLIVLGALLLGGVIWKREELATMLTRWKKAKNAERYLPALNAAERKYGLPPDLLARMAFQESRFRDDIVKGETKSGAGAVGLMQIVPKWHPTVNPLNVPEAIDYAARFVKQLHGQFKSWPLAVAAYNAGVGNVTKYKGIPPFAETQAYVKEIFADLLNATPSPNRRLYA